jgi:hypothetical protein
VVAVDDRDDEPGRPAVLRRSRQRAMQGEGRPGGVGRGLVLAAACRSEPGQREEEKQDP